jgi:lysophospholipase L1-like esterase
MPYRRALVLCVVLCGCGDGEPDMAGTGGAGGDPQGGGGRGGTEGAAGRGGGSGASGGAAGGGAGGTTGGAGAGGSGGSAAGRGGTGGPATGGSTGTAGTGGAAGRGGTGGSGTSGAAGRGGSGGSGGSGGAGVAGLEAAGVRLFGRADISNPAQPRFSWSGTGFIARFSGTGLTARLNNTGAFIFKAVVDGAPRAAFTTTTGTANYDLATGLGAGTHTVELYRQTEAGQGNSQLVSLTVAGGSLSAPPPGPGRLIEVIGDSISAGYGTLGTLADTECFSTESHWDTYQAIAARAVGAEVSTIAASGRGMYRNYGGDMTDTLPMVYARTLMNDASPVWGFAIQPQVVVINLGTNDISNGKGDPGMPFRDAYRGFVEMLRAKYPNALIICMIGPLLSGSELTTIQGHIRAVVQARNTAGDANIEYFGDVVAQTSDKAACQYHPNPAENLIVGNQLAGELRARLGW